MGIANKVVGSPDSDLSTRRGPHRPGEWLSIFQPSGRCRKSEQGERRIPSPSATWLRILRNRRRPRLPRPSRTLRLDHLGNLPWSAEPYRAMSSHAFEHGDNVVLLVRLHNAIGTLARHQDYRQHGHGHGLKEIVACDWQEAGFAGRGVCPLSASFPAWLDQWHDADGRGLPVP